MRSVTLRSQTPAASRTSSDPHIWTEHWSGGRQMLLHQEQAVGPGLGSYLQSLGHKNRFRRLWNNRWLSSQQTLSQAHQIPARTHEEDQVRIPALRECWALGEASSPLLATSTFPPLPFSFSLSGTASRKPSLTASSSPTSQTRSPVKYSCSPSISLSY